VQGATPIGVFPYSISKLQPIASRVPQAGTLFSIYGRRKAEGIRLKEKTKKKIKPPEPT
jgi:hypothetical protein